jgi:hypothetical protein
VTTYNVPLTMREIQALISLLTHCFETRQFHGVDNIGFLADAATTLTEVVNAAIARVDRETEGKVGK